MAHYLVGNAGAYTTADWQDDLSLAQAAGIDAFGLDIAAGDSRVPASLATAFAAAESMSGRTIKLYLIFDYAAWGAWPSSEVISLINEYKTSPAYFNYTGKPLVSTFEGPANADDWTTIKSVTPCYFVPDWSSIGAAAAASHSAIDGLASWDAWPEGPNNLTTSDDLAYLSALGGSKSYMMPVSPWFYTDLPQYSKNWLWYSDSLWHLRWLQAASLAPTFIQIISWNDYGESHYIGPIRPSGVVSGAWYVDNAHDHSAWTTFLPQYISAFHAGSTSILSSAAPSDKLVYSYKSNPTLSSSSTVCNNPSYQPSLSPSLCSPSTVILTVSLTAPAALTLTMSGSSQSINVPTAGISNYIFQIDAGALGTPVFEVVRNAGTVMRVEGKVAISSAQGGTGVNWNPVVGVGGS